MKDYNLWFFGDIIILNQIASAQSFCVILQNKNSITLSQSVRGFAISDLPSIVIIANTKKDQQNKTQLNYNERKKKVY